MKQPKVKLEYLSFPVVPYAGDPEEMQFCISRERSIEIHILQHVQMQYGVVLYNDSSPGLKLTRGCARKVPELLRNSSDKQVVPFSASRWIRDWAVHPELTKFCGRKIIFSNVASFLEHRQALWSLIEDQKGMGFVKTVEKGTSFNGTLAGLNEMDPFFLMNYNLASQIMLSEYIELGPKEWRTFVIDNKPTTFSTYCDYFDDEEADNDPGREVESLANEIAVYIKENFPAITHYVMDLGINITTGLPVLIELNCITSSGRYIHNDFCRILEALTGLSCDKPYREFVEEWDRKYIHEVEPVRPVTNAERIFGNAKAESPSQ